MDATICTLLDQSRGPKIQSSTVLTSWNPRWLLSHSTAQAADKKQAIMNLLLKGNIVALQETHWHASAAARWENSFPGSKVATAPRPPSEAPKGGGWVGLR
jgi:hypothetical protein